MRKLRVGINGFGRIGRLVLRAFIESGRRDLTYVAINDLGSIAANARLLARDSTHGPFPGHVEAKDDAISVNDRSVRVFQEKDPARLPWGELQVDLVMECTGRFTTREAAEAHLRAGARRVLVSAPCAGADVTVVYGVNHRLLSRAHKVISNASCTTNCLAPMACILHEAVGIARGHMTTVHACTGDQRLLDTFHKDPARGRAAILSLIPTTTGAAKAVGLVLPELAGKLDGTAIRTPVSNVSLVDFVFDAQRETSAQEIRRAMESAAQGAFKDVVETNDEPLVSIDFNHSPASCTFDVHATQVIDKKLVRAMAWYDNEWGFSNRMNDVAAWLGRHLHQA